MATWAVTTAGASKEFDTQNGEFNTCFKIDTNHFINFWAGGASSTGRVQVFTVNTTTWAITTAAASLEHDTAGNCIYNSCCQIDANHFINFYRGLDADGFAQVIAVNTSTWGVTTASARLEFDTQNAPNHNCFQIDSNHVINFWGGGASFHAYVQTFAIDTTTWAVTTAAASLEYDTQGQGISSCYQVDSNHFINFWKTWDGDGYAQIFAVNTTTWAVTTAAALLEFDTQNGNQHSCFQVDANHFINFYKGNSTNHGFVEVFAVNTTTWAITTTATRLEFDTQDAQNNRCYRVDTNHFINFWTDVNGDGFSQVFEVNTTTWAVTTAAASLEYDTTDAIGMDCTVIDSNHFINFWTGVDGDGFAQVFTVELPSTTSIKTINGLAKASVKTWNGLAIASVKTFNGLA